MMTTRHRIPKVVIKLLEQAPRCALLPKPLHYSFYYDLPDSVAVTKALKSVVKVSTSMFTLSTALVKVAIAASKSSCVT